MKVGLGVRGGTGAWASFAVVIVIALLTTVETVLRRTKGMWIWGCFGDGSGRGRDEVGMGRGGAMTTTMMISGDINVNAGLTSQPAVREWRMQRPNGIDWQ